MMSNWQKKGCNKYKVLCPVITALDKGETYDSVFDPFPVCVHALLDFVVSHSLHSLSFTFEGVSPQHVFFFFYLL